MAIRIDHDRSSLFCDRRCGYMKPLSQNTVRSGLKMLEAAETAQKRHKCSGNQPAPIKTPSQDRWKELFKDIDLS